MRYIFDDPETLAIVPNESEFGVQPPDLPRCARCKGTGDCGRCRGDGLEGDGLRPCRECHGSEFCGDCGGDGVVGA